MKLVKQEPVPPPLPPATYDLIGMSEHQAAILKKMLLAVSTGDTPELTADVAELTAQFRSVPFLRDIRLETTIFFRRVK